MFTGIVEGVGEVRSVTPLANGLRVEIASPLASSLRAGDSVACAGVCLTAVDPGDGLFSVETVATTLERTTLAELRPGRRLNLERALALGDRLGGHLVQGHVDGVGEVVGLRREGDHVAVQVRLPEPVLEVTVPRGSIAIDGVSMTVVDLDPPVARVAVIPYTWEHTTFRDLSVGARVNLEGDMLGRFVVHYLKQSGRGRV